MRDFQWVAGYITTRYYLRTGAMASAVSVKLDEKTQERMRRLAEARSRAPHYLMREAINQYLDREEARESFKQEALSSWAEFQETGLHLTGDEASAWLNTWGIEDETPTPPCHE
jgi:predicted transcriptional regulator